MGKQRRYEMVNYDLRIEKQRIFGAEKIAIAANANETISLCFHFDANWRIFDAKAAIFRTAKNEYYIIEIKESSAKVPWEVLAVDHDFELSVIGYDGSVVLTAGKVDVRVVSSLLPDDYKTFSPSETLFDRFKQDSIDETYKKYEDEIESLKYAYEKKILEMGVKINKANENTKNVEKAKDAEIAEIRQEHAEENLTFNTKIAELNKSLSAAQLKADKWDLVDAAMEDKTRSNFALWTGGTKEYKLPFLNTKNMATLSSGNFDNNVTELGLDLTSATTLESMFMSKKSLRRIELRNTDNITSIQNGFSNSTSLREVILGDMTHCNTFRLAFNTCTSLEKVTLGKHSRVVDFSYMFQYCYALKEIVGELNLLVARATTSMFEGCSNLEKVSFARKSINMDISLLSCQSLSRESVLSLLNGLVENGERTLNLSKYAFDNSFPDKKEQEEKIAELQQKGWELVLG